MVKLIDNETQKEIFYNVSNDPEQYLRVGETLKYAADKILNEYSIWYDEKKKNLVIDIRMGLYPVYLMISGYALENILKGIYCAKGGRFLKWSGDGHNLDALIKDINKLASEECNMIQKISYYCRGKGRYPTMKTFEEVNGINSNEPFKTSNGSYNDKFETWVMHFFNPSIEVPMLNKIYERFMNILQGIII